MVDGRDDYQLSYMPVILYPNFMDLSGDISPDGFFLLVGNENGESLKKLTLRELLGNLRAHLHDPNSWKGSRSSLRSETAASRTLSVPDRAILVTEIAAR